MDNQLNHVVIRQIKFNSSEYVAEISLRSRVLREPLGLLLSDKDLENEYLQIHFGAFVGEKLVGCLILLPLNREAIKMRQVAVDNFCQKSGVGTALITTAEEFAKGSGYKRICLNARESAINFYLKMGYRIYGEPHVEVSIPHKLMEKIFV